MHIQEPAIPGSIFVLSKPLGKDVVLKIGEIVEGEVWEVFPQGGMALKVKEATLPVRSTLPFSKGDVLTLKVLGERGKSGELVLQWLGRKERGEGDEGVRISTALQARAGEKTGVFGPEASLKGLGRFVQTLLSSPLDPQKTAKLLETVFKVISHENIVIPENIKINLIKGMLDSVKEGLGGLASKIQRLMEGLPKEWIQGVVSDPRQGISRYPSLEGITGDNLREVLENSGVLLETKVKALAQEAGADPEFLAVFDKKITNDIKYILLKLKTIIEEKINEDLLRNLPKGSSEKGIFSNREEALAFVRKTIGEINLLLREVETFQLLSKISEAFVVFLPIPWSSLRRGELVFKRKGEPGKGLFSCGIRLHLDGLGEVSAFLLMLPGNTFFLDLRVEDERFRSLLAEGLEELREGFKKHGLVLTYGTIQSKSDEGPDPFQTAFSGETLISIRI